MTGILPSVTPLGYPPRPRTLPDFPTKSPRQQYRRAKARRGRHVLAGYCARQQYRRAKARRGRHVLAGYRARQQYRRAKARRGRHALAGYRARQQYRRAKARRGRQAPAGTISGTVEFLEAAVRTHRRLTTAVVGCALAALALAGCRSAPTVAAYVGSTQITEEDIDSIVAGAQIDLPRQDALRIIVLEKVCQAMQAEQGFAGAQVTTEQVAAQYNLPASAEFTKRFASMLACLNGIPAGSGKPSEADMREAYVNGSIQGQSLQQFPYDQVKQVLTAETMGSAVAQRDSMTKAADQQHVSVNPRYRDLTLQVPIKISVSTQNQIDSYLTVQLGQAGNGAVTDAPQSVPSAQAPQS